MNRAWWFCLGWLASLGPGAVAGYRIHEWTTAAEPAPASEEVQVYRLPPELRMPIGRPYVCRCVQEPPGQTSMAAEILGAVQ